MRATFSAPGNREVKKHLLILRVEVVRSHCGCGRKGSRIGSPANSAMLAKMPNTSRPFLEAKGNGGNRGAERDDRRIAESVVNLLPEGYVGPFTNGHSEWSLDGMP
jgi:hypothetical protein